VSDLQCAATLLLVRPGTDPEDLGPVLVGRRLVAVYSDATAPAVRTAETLAAATGVVRVVAREGLAETSTAGELSAIADEHRGETVAVVARTGLGPEGAAVVELVVDADGWVVRSLIRPD
jgi:hypothetical protein